MWNTDGPRPLLRLVLCLLLPAACIAQTDSTAASDSTMLIRAGVSPDTLGRGLSSVSAPLHETKSPWVAVGLSAIAPGAGQIYNENYWKAPVIWALGGYWVYEWTKQNNRYWEFRALYDQSITPSLPAGNRQYKDLREFYHDERDKFAWFIGGLYFLNLLDAYVGAHLYDFDVSPDLTADGTVVPRVTATVRFTF